MKLGTLLSLLGDDERLSGGALAIGLGNRDGGHVGFWVGREGRVVFGESRSGGGGSAGVGGGRERAEGAKGGGRLSEVGKRSAADGAAFEKSGSEEGRQDERCMRGGGR